MVPERAPSAPKKKSSKSSAGKGGPQKTKKMAPPPAPEVDHEVEQDEPEETHANLAPETSVEAREAHPGEEHHDDEDRDSDRRPSVSAPQAEGNRAPNPPQNNRPVAPFKSGDDYTLSIRYDKNSRIFVGEVVEFPELRTTGMSREQVMKDLGMKLEDYIEDHRHQGGVPEAIFSRTYPDRLNIPVSQSVYRKLDTLSRYEKVALDHLVVELLSSAVDRRLDGGKAVRHQQPSNQHQQHNHNHQGGGNQQRHGGGGGHHQRHGGGHNRGGRHSQVALESRENFLEYVRSLEKGGGSGRWKK